MTLLTLLKKPTAPAGGGSPLPGQTLSLTLKTPIQLSVASHTNGTLTLTVHN